MIIVMTIVNDGLYTHTTILIDALFILGHGVQRVPIDIYSFISYNSEKWPHCQIPYLVGNYSIIAACLDIISEPLAETLYVHLCKPSPTTVRVVFT
jgi:hypothetical protein